MWFSTIGERTRGDLDALLLFVSVYLGIELRTFGPKRDEVTKKWKELHNEELNDLYSSRSIVRVIKSRRMRWAGHVARMGTKSGVYRVLVGKLEGKRPLGRPRRRWKDNIKLDLEVVVCGWYGVVRGG
jgi:hypothetical protein